MKKIFLIPLSMLFTTFMLMVSFDTYSQETEATSTQSENSSEESPTNDPVQPVDSTAEEVPTIKVSFSKNLTKVKELYGDGSSNHQIEITVNSEEHIDEDVILTLKVESKSDSLADAEFSIISSTLVLPKKASGEIFEDEKIVATIEIHGDIKAEETEFLDLKLGSSTSNNSNIEFDNRFHTVEIENGTEPVNLDNPIRLYIGSNFDFFDGASVDDLFANVEVFLPNSFCKDNKWGLISGITQNQSLSFDSIAVSGLSRKYFATALEDGLDSIGVVSQSMDLNSRVSVRNTEMHLSVFYNWHKSKHLNLHIGAQGMAVWRNYTYDYTYPNLKRDTVNTAIADLGTDIRTIPISTPPRRTRTFNDTYLGFCAPITYSSKYGELFIQPGIGMMWLEEGPKVGYLNWKFRVTESKLGITFGGEIFSTITLKNSELPSTSSRLNTIYNIYVAKAFNLSNLLNYGN